MSKLPVSLINFPETIQHVVKSWITYVVVGAAGSLWYLATTLTVLSSQTASLQQELTTLKNDSVNKEIVALRSEVDRLSIQVSRWSEFKRERDIRHQTVVDGNGGKVHHHRQNRVASSIQK